ncbi:hypothetical protein TSUD_172790 [Trifolium subterraneum]|uniref:Uncharacterized protein n=1 Tax=Trifolium subterraneum TaxID=3900 RepID=A0A2Z6MIU0_TRISU|nr:hypothetical protein TSUD_172790 [Trifolium subterraneum]
MTSGTYRQTKTTCSMPTNADNPARGAHAGESVCKIEKQGRMAKTANMVFLRWRKWYSSGNASKMKSFVVARNDRR